MTRRMWFPRAFLGSVLLAGSVLPARLRAEIPPETQLELARVSFLDRGLDTEIFLAHLLRSLDPDPTQGRKILDHLVKLERAIDKGTLEGRTRLEEYLEAKRRMRDATLQEDTSDPAQTDTPMSRVLVTGMAWRKSLQAAEELRGAAVDDLEISLTEAQKQALGAANIDQYLHVLGVTSQELEECALHVLASTERPEAELLDWTQSLLEQNGQTPSPENLENVQTWFLAFQKLSEADRASNLANYARELRDSLHPDSTASVGATEPLTGDALNNAVRSNIEQYLLDVRLIPVLQKRLEAPVAPSSPSSAGN